MNVLIPQPKFIIPQFEVTKAVSVVYPVSIMTIQQIIKFINTYTVIFAMISEVYNTFRSAFASIPAEVNFPIATSLEHCPPSSILHVTVGQKRFLVFFGSDAVETAWRFQSVKQLRAV